MRARGPCWWATDEDVGNIASGETAPRGWVAAMGGPCSETGKAFGRPGCLQDE